MIPEVLNKLIGKYVTPKLIACQDGYWEYNGICWTKTRHNFHKALFLNYNPRNISRKSEINKVIPIGFGNTFGFAFSQTIDKKWYCFGGDRYNTANNEVASFNGTKWIIEPSMILKRSGPYVVSISKKFIVIGGNTNPLKCEMFDIETHIWKEISDIPLRGVSAYLDIRVYENEVFVVSNRDLFKYDLKSDTWTFEALVPFSTDITEPGIHLLFIA